MHGTGLSRLLLPDVKQILEEGDHVGLGEALSDLHPADVAELIEQVDVEQRPLLFRSLSGPARVHVYEHLDEDVQTELLSAQDSRQLASMLDDMSSDDRADLIKALPESVQATLLRLLSGEEAQDVRQLMAYPEETAGAVMTSEYASVGSELTTAEALQRLRGLARTKETIYYTYVVDDDGRLRGVVSLTELVVSDPDTPVKSLLEHDVVYGHVDDDQEEIAQTIAKYDFLALPIVDADRRLVGIVTHDDVLDIVSEEQTEDVQKMGAVEPLDQPYTKTPLWELIHKRGLWLIVLFFVGVGTCAVLKAFDRFFDDYPFLAFFIPLVISSGGNAGSQSATLIVRAIALGEIRLKHWVRVVGRELLIGLTLGTILGGLGLVVGPIFLSDDSPIKPLTVATVVCITVVTVVTTGAIVGSLIPLTLEKLGLDPAVMSTPFVASIIDVAGIAIYMGLAARLLPPILGAG